MKFQKKSVSKIALTDLLRRKRTNLGKYISENGIFSYELLVSRCFSVGVIPPTEEQFSKAGGSVGVHAAVSSPTEGIVVLNPALESVFEHEHVVLASHSDMVESAANLHLEDDKKEENIVDFLPAAEKKQRKKRSSFSHQNEESND